MNKDSQIKISLYNIIKTISDSIDLVSNEITGHHKLVAYLSIKIGQELGLSNEEMRQVAFSALIHDIGILYFEENIDEILRKRQNEEHAYVGYLLLKDYFPFDNYAEIIRNHHNDWENLERNKNNYLSNIINLADITAFFIDKYKDNNILNNNIMINEISKYCNNKIDSVIVDSLYSLSGHESFWLDTVNLKIRENILEEYIEKNLDISISLDQVLDISEIVSRIIDFRNPFTATHSKGISTVAAKLAEDVSFSSEDKKIMKIAGYFHDIGKMIIPLNIINKKGRLKKEEWAVMKSHTYYSYYVLDNIKEIPKMKEWSAFHHETLDGKGYPFNIDHNKLSVGARIMAVSDIFTALTEDRPYRKGFSKDKVIQIIKNKVKNNKIDNRIVNILLDKFDVYNFVRNEQQKKTNSEYKIFKKRTRDGIKSIY